MTRQLTARRPWILAAFVLASAAALNAYVFIMMGIADVAGPWAIVVIGVVVVGVVGVHDVRLVRAAMPRRRPSAAAQAPATP